MMQNSFIIKYLIYILLLLSFYTHANSTIMILSGCKSIQDTFVKNEYILDLEKSLMIRSYIYDTKTYKKYRVTDLSVKKENSLERFIYKEEDLIFTDKIGYPQFYTQLIFKIKSPIVKLKTVINNEEGITKISTCKKVEIFDGKS